MVCVTRMPQVLIAFSFVTVGRSLLLWIFCFVLFSCVLFLFVCKGREPGEVIVKGFLLRNFDSVSEELTHLKELGEGYHFCLSEAKNTSRL